MKKSKSPVLTSPWKIGFLVSLLLILTSVGVNLMLMRTFKLSWSWLNIESGKLAFHPDQFIDQIVPQLSILIALCLAAYFAVTSAVRRYKAYLDSGLDYKNLVKSIKGVADLNDDSALKKLDAYPELRNLLADLRARISEQERIVEQQIERLADKTKDDDLDLQLEEECARLVEAIRERIASGGEREWDPPVTIPELKSVAEAISDIPVASRSRCGSEERERMARLHQELQEAGAYIRSRLEEISKELSSNGREAKNIEAQINTLKTAIEHDDSARRAGDAVATMEQLAGSVSNIQRLSESLQELGEDTKSIAISTALQAGSGEGALADLIQLAEGVKEIAEKYEQYAESYRDMTGQMAKLSSKLHSHLKSSAAKQDSAASSSVNTLTSKMSLWVERIVVLSDTIKTLGKSYNLSFQTLEERISGYAELNAEEEYSLKPHKPEENEAVAKDDGVFEIQSSGSDVFHHDREHEGSFSDTRDVPFEGFERERKFFGGAGRADGTRHAGSPLEIPGHPVEFEVEADDSRSRKLSASDGRLEDTEQRELGAVRFGSFAHPAGDVERAGGPDGRTRFAPDARTESLQDDDEEVIDLYALGAVDYAAHHAGSQL